MKEFILFVISVVGVSAVFTLLLTGLMFLLIKKEREALFSKLKHIWNGIITWKTHE
jgi:dihydrodipicolinate synthase/N-acetylneuraminate lyase